MYKPLVSSAQLTVALGWFLSTASLVYLVYGLHVFHLDVAGSALYASVGHSAWGAALAWIVIACCTGHGGCVNSALSCRLLQPLSRLTYCAYLVHPLIMAMTNFQMDGPLHLHNLITVNGSFRYELITARANRRGFPCPASPRIKIIREKANVKEKKKMPLLGSREGIGI